MQFKCCYLSTLKKSFLFAGKYSIVITRRADFILSFSITVLIHMRIWYLYIKTMASSVRWYLFEMMSYSTVLLLCALPLVANRTQLKVICMYSSQGTFTQIWKQRCIHWNVEGKNKQTETHRSLKRITLGFNVLLPN